MAFSKRASNSANESATLAAYCGSMPISGSKKNGSGRVEGQHFATSVTCECHEPRRVVLNLYVGVVAGYIFNRPKSHVARPTLARCEALEGAMRREEVCVLRRARRKRCHLTCKLSGRRSPPLQRRVKQHCSPTMHFGPAMVAARDHRDTSESVLLPKEQDLE